MSNKYLYLDHLNHLHLVSYQMGLSDHLFQPVWSEELKLIENDSFSIQAGNL